MAVKRELLPLGAVLNRWHMLSRIASEEGNAVARAYEEVTWRETAEKLTAGVPFDARRLQHIDDAALAEVKRRRESAATISKPEPN